MSSKAARRKFNREQLAKVEQILGPEPFKINGAEILHEHLRSGNIRFSAWQGDDPVPGGRFIVVPKAFILSQGERFWEVERDNMYWLAEHAEVQEVSHA